MATEETDQHASCHIEVEECSELAGRKRSGQGFFQTLFRPGTKKTPAILEQELKALSDEDLADEQPTVKVHKHDENGPESVRLLEETGCETPEPARDATVDVTRRRWGKLKSSLMVMNAVSAPRKKGTLERQDSFLKKFSTRQQPREEQVEPAQSSQEQQQQQQQQQAQQQQQRIDPLLLETSRCYVIKPDSNATFYWLGIVSAAVLYNLWLCIARQAFRELQEMVPILWYTLDAIADVIYIADLAVQFRTGYLEQGLVVRDPRKLARHYTRSRPFVIDVVSLLPLDFVQLVAGHQPLLRFPRFLKIYRAYQFYYMQETRTIYPNTWRVANMCHVLFLLAHWFAGFYFLISKAENFEGEWAYPHPIGEMSTISRKYLRSLYWSFLTLTTIGDLPPPKTNWQYVFQIGSYMIGVFIFATIVGQVGNVITNRNASRLEFERLLDGAKQYMRHHNVPAEMQRRVQRWYDYSWSRGRMSGAGDIHSIGLLPDKLKTELALHVNLRTLKKVTIFQECQPEFLHDLVLKMKAFIFTPGDLVCRKGEVAREMFIIADGVLEVINENGEVLTRMVAGDFFGEIGILNIEGAMNRRTADVRSVGYSELFSLSKEDVLAAMKDYPEAEQVLRTYGRRRYFQLKTNSPKPTVPPKPIAEHRKKEATRNPVFTMLGQLSQRNDAAQTGAVSPQPGTPPEQTDAGTGAIVCSTVSTVPGDGIRSLAEEITLSVHNFVKSRLEDDFQEKFQRLQLLEEENQVKEQKIAELQAKVDQLTVQRLFQRRFRSTSPEKPSPSPPKPDDDAAASAQQ